MTSKETRRRKALIDTIELRGYDAKMYCSFCTVNGRRCIMSTSHSRCSECVRLGRSKCDGKPEFLDGWEALTKQEERLREEEEEAMAKILRLRKQQKFLQRRRNDMMARGLRSLQELDEAEEKEREKEEAEKQKSEEAQKSAELAAAELLSSGDPVDPSYDPSSDPSLGLPVDPSDPF